MSKASHYWTIARLTAAGQINRVELSSAHEFFQQYFPNLAEQDEIADELIQTQLLPLWKSTDAAISTLAALCLRCCISHQIVQVCTALQAQFGQYRGFTLQDLLPYALNDHGRLPADPDCLAQKILQSFQPELSSLSTWTTHHVRQDKRLNEVLVEHGLYLVSDWAILNDTKPEQLRRIFAGFYSLTAIEIDRACILLESYRAVYLPDRLKQPRGKCSVPTEDQLKRIGHLIQAKSANVIPSDVLLTQLQRLAKRLRQYRIHKRGGPLPAESIDTPEGQATVEALETNRIHDLQEHQQQSEFLQLYQRNLLQNLSRAFEQVVSDRQQKSKQPEQAMQFITALYLFYCEKMSMTAIAPRLGLRGQDSVTRLLKLKDFRADVRRHMLKHLRSDVLEAAKAYCDPDRLQQLDDQIEAALNEQLEALMQQDAKRTQTPKDLMLKNVFAQTLCEYLDRVHPQPSSQPEPNHE